jgi:ATP-binding cassette subfamily G (WHITE) protein 2
VPAAASHSGTYYASAYFMAKVTAELATQLPIPLLFSAIVYWLVGLQPLFPEFSIFCGFMVLCNMAATSLALTVSTWCRGVDLAITVLPMMLEACRLFGGFFLSPANTPRYYEFLNALSYVKVGHQQQP